MEFKEFRKKCPWRAPHLGKWCGVQVGMYSNNPVPKCKKKHCGLWYLKKITMV